MISQAKPSSFHIISESYQQLFSCMKNALLQMSDNYADGDAVLKCVEMAKLLQSQHNKLSISMESPWEQTIAIFSPFWFPIMLPLFKR